MTSTSEFLKEKITSFRVFQIFKLLHARRVTKLIINVYIYLVIQIVLFILLCMFFTSNLHGILNTFVSTL